MLGRLLSLYILGDEDLHYSDTNETAHLIKSPIHPNLFRVTHDTENTSRLRPGKFILYEPVH